MKIKNLVGFLLGTMILSAAAFAQAADDVGVMSTVMGLEQTWLDSQQTNNTDLLAPLLADNVADTTTEGKLMTGKDAVIADGKSVKWNKAEYSEMRIAVYGDAAIATAVFSGQGTDSSGKPVNVHEHFTDTWIKMPDGHWRCVATHGSLIKG